MKDILALIALSGLGYMSYKYVQQAMNPVRDVIDVPETPEGETDVHSTPIEDFIEENSKQIENSGQAVTVRQSISKVSLPKNPISAISGFGKNSTMWTC